jgi:hypothetical protein
MKFRAFLYAALMCAMGQIGFNFDLVTGEVLQDPARRGVDRPPAVIEQSNRMLRSN